MRALLDKPKKAVNKLKKYKVGALFMEAGTGKTSAAYTLINSVRPDYVLYFAPFQSIHTDNYSESIPAEIERCGGFYMDFDFIGVESISNSDRMYLNLIKKLKNAKNPFIVCDESLKIKNSNAKRTQRLFNLGDMVEYKLVLNGTPVSRNLLDLWAQMRFLSRNILKMDEAEYKNTFCEYTKMTKRIGCKTIKREWINRYHNLDYLYKLISPFIFESNLSLNVGIQRININYSLSELELQYHKEIKEKYLDNEEMQARNNNIFLEITQKLQHNYSCSHEKFEIVKNILSKNDKSKVLICAKYIDTQEKLKENFSGVRILSWQKNSFALNLQSYNVLIKFDKHWDYALHEQLEHRIYRTGQKEDCLIYDLTGNVGLENLMNKNIESKGKMLKAFKQKSIKQLQKEL